MALEGSLKEFGLADILQLIYYQRKTGVLSLESRLDRVRLLFYEGKIVSAESRKRTEDNRLGRILVKKGLVDEAKLREAMREQKSTGARLGNVLIKNGLVGKEQLQEILTSQITEIITQLFAWKEGRYEFKPQGVPVDKDLPLSIDTQHLLMEGLRIVDEWSLLEGKIALGSVFEKAGGADGGQNDLEVELLGFVDGKSDVSTIIDLSGRDNFEVSKALLGLMEKGVIAHAAEKPPEVKEEPRPGEGRGPATGVIIYAVAVVALVISIVSMPSRVADLSAFRASEDLDRLRLLVDAYKFEKGSYPPALDEVSREKDPWGEPYLYSLKDDGYSLLSAGPDRQPGTPDDLR